jgi:hypothetical protein
LLLVISSLFAFGKEGESSQAVKDLRVKWYFPRWLGISPYAPVFEVKDTVNKYGRYATQTKAITIKDLIKFHGHFCGGDGASYLTGACLRFGSHHIDNFLKESEFIVQKVSTGKAVHVKLNPAVYPVKVKTQMKKIESGNFTPKDIDLFQELQWAYTKRLISRPLRESFLVEEMKGYEWPKPICQDFGTKKDNDYKKIPANNR